VKELGMTVQTSISNQVRELNLDQKHTLKFDKSSELILGEECSPELINSMIMTLKNLFIGSPKPIVLNELNILEKLMICIILFKKNKLNVCADMTQENFDAIMREIRTKKSQKRSEEKLKFIFKRCLKYLLDQFSNKIKNNNGTLGKPTVSKSKNLLQEFYQHYYVQIAKKMNLSLNEFFPPNRSKSVQGTSNKTLNLDYLSKLAKNPIILTSMITYMNQSFQKEYMKELDSSLRTLVEKMTKMIRCQYIDLCNNPEEPRKLFKKNEIDSLKTLLSDSMGKQLKKELMTANQSEDVDKASKLLRRMKTTVLKQKMKIPWTVREIQEGIFFVKKKLKRIQKKNLLN
jgi:hypothetical protein